jgi:hypothetical protein
MLSGNPSPSLSKTHLWIGRVLSAVPALMLVFSAAMNLAHPPGLDEGFAHLELPISMATALGVLELACTAIYIVPKTSVLGAILLTGYLGGATLTHLRVGHPYFITPLLGVLIWGGLYLRDPRLQTLLPFVSNPRS